MKRRYRVRITLAGYLLVALTLALALAAVNTGNNLLYLVTATFLALMTVSGLFSWFNLRGVRVQLEPPKEIFAATPTPFRVDLKGPLWPCLFLTLKTPYGKTALPFLKRRKTTELWLTFPSRGSYRLESLELSSGYPLGFFRRARFIPFNLEVLVYPCPLSGPIKEEGVETEEGRAREAFRRGEPEDWAGLEPYREGAPLSRLAWKSLARWGKPQLKTFEAPSYGELWLDLRGLRSEREISFATQRILEALQAGQKVGLRLPKKTIPPGSGPSHRKILLEALARA